MEDKLIFIKEKLELYYDKEIVNDILEGYKTSRLVTFRVNTIKSSVEEVVSVLESEKIKYVQIDWYSNAFIVYCDLECITKLDIYDQGKIYVQSLSSMLPPLFLNPASSEMILDMAAAPGGKTTEMADLSENMAMITAVEKNKIRAERLKYNIEKQGVKKVSILNTDARRLDEIFSFDKVLLDAPCRGSGTLSVFDNSFDTFNQELIDRSVNTQVQLLNKAIKLTKVGGYILYSTCSVLKCENEEVVNKVIKDGNVKIVKINFEKFKDIPLLPVTIDGTICVCPNQYYEGFYVALLKKIK